MLTLSSDPSSRKFVSRANILYCFEVGIPNLDYGYMLGCQSVPYRLGSLLTWPLAHLLYYWRLRNPQFSVLIHLGVEECRTLFIDQCVSWMKIYCLWGYFINYLWHNSWFCLIINSKTVQFKGIFIGGTTFFLTKKKILNCTKSISTFSLSTQYPYSMIQGKQTL